MRSDGIQKLILNSSLFLEMVCEVVQEKNIRFSAISLESKIQTYLLRVLTKIDKHILKYLDQKF